MTPLSPILLVLIAWLGGLASSQENFCRLTQGLSSKKVLLVGLDGWGSLYVQREYMPNLWREILDEGSWTMDSRNVRETSSKPNWATLLMGSGPEHTSIIDNSWEPIKGFRPTEQFIPSATKGKVFPTIYSEMKKANKAFTTLHSTDHDVVINLVDDYDEDLDAFAYFQEDPEGLVDWVRECYNSTGFVPDFAFVHFDGIDGGGHTAGWGSQTYRRALEEADEQVKSLFQVYKDMGVWDQTLVVVGSDHGGTETGHGNDHLSDLLVPVFFKGPGVAKQQLLTQIENTDVTPTMLSFLGIPPPKSWTGRVLEEIFNPSENVDPGLAFYGAEDWCHGLKRCEEIEGTDCGWCRGRGKGMLGHPRRGPFKEDCLEGWVWAASDC